LMSGSFVHRSIRRLASTGVPAGQVACQ
jgi:hypothetical protein